MKQALDLYEDVMELSVPLREKYKVLREVICRFDSALIAYSGGVDSALVMTVAYSVLKSNALACIGVSPSYPLREMEEAINVAKRMEIPYRLIQTEEYLDANYIANSKRRCYFCKSELYGRLHKIAEEESWRVVFDGTNVSDLGDDRPGIIAGKERGIYSPLVEANINKAEVRQLAKFLGLPVWDKPAMACLSSRVPHGTKITPGILKQIEMAENVLRDAGFKQFRVRHHRQIARIEVEESEVVRAATLNKQLVQGIKAVGYQFVTLDLSGFRSGSLNGVSQITINLPVKNL